ncbi:T. brucei spp.-specific protein [Trypanosoma brucei gambiense DAL972]|uniref:Uncharacterized protein n=1 Tax=Trypanosoma brucei gambiense (strain MHOM/CI/86/DAL972) TaxID=679716 RepID=C9ZL37_TRYB9|nr:T. brucei spp.-specific protein [Trypanosoma brucei gambiense DAL972]CBH10046.1 T. brucei spp.-specific protein [Trypanosoma brucei gambiense DAL972]|eukprot:XP_011772336.1 T. brucei spp.-specific protein [Trypanosoma brucei gambiense DAL972]
MGVYVCVCVRNEGKSTIKQKERFSNSSGTQIDIDLYYFRMRKLSIPRCRFVPAAMSTLFTVLLPGFLPLLAPFVMGCAKGFHAGGIRFPTIPKLSAVFTIGKGPFVPVKALAEGKRRTGNMLDEAEAEGEEETVEGSVNPAPPHIGTDAGAETTQGLIFTSAGSGHSALGAEKLPRSAI